MPDFAVVTNFRVNEGLTRFFAQGATGATRFQAAVEGAFKRSSAAASTFSQVFGGVTLGNLAANGVRRVGSEIKELALGSKDAARDLAALKTAYGSVFGGDATTQMAFATSEADRLGLSVEAAARGYMKISAASKGTSMAGAVTRDIFIGVSEASAAMKLSGEQTSGALLALEQIISKGKLSAEELRGQLGERIPGAFQIAARAMGMTTERLTKVMSDPKAGIMSDEFIPRFAAQLRKEFGPAALQAAKDFGAVETRFFSAKLKMQQGIGEELIPLMTKFYEKVTPMMPRVVQGFREAIPVIRGVINVAKEIGPPILAAAAAFQIVKGGFLAASWAAGIFKTVNTIIFAFQAVSAGAATKMEALNMVMRANPMGLVCAAIAVLVGLFTLLANKVGGVGPAFLVLGQTLMKGLLLPDNLIIDGFSFLLGLMSKIPGLGKTFGGWKEGLETFQSGMNTTLTGSDAAYDLSRPYDDARWNKLAADKREAAVAPAAGSSFSGRIDVYGPPGTTAQGQGTRGARELRLDYMGANP